MRIEHRLEAERGEAKEGELAQEVADVGADGRPRAAPAPVALQGARPPRLLGLADLDRVALLQGKECTTGF